MMTCYLRYEIAPFKAKEFETYAKMWLPLVKKFGGTHHGYFLPHEGGDYVAIRIVFISVACRLRSLSRQACQRS
jgi:NIPSNAP protein